MLKTLEIMNTANNYNHWIVEEIKPYLGKVNAEVGAGIGSISKLIAPHVEKLIAFEPDETLIPILRNNINGRAEIINSTLTPIQRLDSLIYINVLEHIENDRLELKKAYNILKQDGCLIVFVPALQWLYSDFDKSIGHYRRYYKKELVNLIENTGFKIVKAKYFDFPGILPWFINFTLLKKHLNISNIRLYDKVGFSGKLRMQNSIKINQNCFF
jgi:hypothetical protein